MSEALEKELGLDGSYEFEDGQTKWDGVTLTLELNFIRLLDTVNGEMVFPPGIKEFHIDKCLNLESAGPLAFQILVIKQRSGYDIVSMQPWLSLNVKRASNKGKSEK